MKFCTSDLIHLVTTTQRIRFAILCARQVYIEPRWSAWADSWLLGLDRSRNAAKEAEAAAWAAEAAGTLDLVALAKQAVAPDSPRRRTT